MYEFVASLLPDAIHNDRKQIAPKELDIYIPNHNIGIEYDGLYWHQNVSMIEKYNICREHEIRLIRFYEDEWINKKEICKSIIKSACGKTSNKIYARKCNIKEVDNSEYKRFMQENHIQGYAPASIKIGLYYNDELVECISIGKSRYKTDEYELIRMASKLDTSVIGGFSKLLAYLKTYKIREIITYVDKRLFDGHGYYANGFNFINETKPSYFYIINGRRESRLNWQKHKLKDKLLIYDDSLSELENMRNNGYNRIYDCGTLKLRKTIYED